MANQKINSLEDVMKNPEYMELIVQKMVAKDDKEYYKVRVCHTCCRIRINIGDETQYCNTLRCSMCKHYTCSDEMDDCGVGVEDEDADDYGNFLCRGCLEKRGKMN